MGARAEDYPSQPIRLLVPAGAGGITDILARIIAAKLTQQLGQQVLVDNRPGAGGIIGTELVAHAAPDGYTLLMVFPSHAANPSLYAKLPYDTDRDFAPITMVTAVSLVLLVPPTLPAHSVEELIALARKTPLMYASSGVGSLGYLAAELFRTMADINLTHVPYKGGPQAEMALLSGEASMFFDPPITAIPAMQSGKLIGLGVTTLKRSPAMPDLPTIAESGLSGYEVVGWNGILAPAHTPAPIIDKLHDEIVAALKASDVRQRLDEVGLQAYANTPEEFAQVIHADIAKWGRVVHDAGIRPE